MPNSTLLSVTEANNPRKVLLDMEIMHNSLRCNLYDTKTGSKVVQTVRLLKFNSLIPNEKWMHVSCFIDGNYTYTPLQVGKNTLQGAIYQDGQEFFYSHSQQNLKGE